MALQYSLGNLKAFKKNPIFNSLPSRATQLTKAHFSMKQKPAASPLTLGGRMNVGKELVDQWRVRAGPGDDRVQPASEGGRSSDGAGPEDQLKNKDTASEGGWRTGGAQLETLALSLSQNFYNSINSKSPERLHQILSEILSENCTIPGVVYYYRYGGKKNVANYLDNVRDAMGENINIVIEKLEFIARPNGSMPILRVNWQLEWINEGKPHVLPLFVGCNEFNFEKVGNKLYISSITGVEEYPVKPRELMLGRLPISASSLPKVLKSIASVVSTSAPPNKELLQKLQGSSLLLVPLLEMLSAYTNDYGG